MKKISKLLSVLLVITMIVSMFTVIPLHAGAAVTELRNRTSDNLAPGVYTVNNDLTVDNRLYVKHGEVEIKISSYSTLNCNCGIGVEPGASLKITGNGHGYLNVKLPWGSGGGAYDNCAHIGGSGGDAGTISISGLTLKRVNGSETFEGAIIGGGSYGSPEAVYLNNLIFNNFSSNDGAAIGGGVGAPASRTDAGVNIVNCFTDDDIYTRRGAGIGNGYGYNGTGGVVNIVDSELIVKATGAAAIGGCEDGNNPVINIRNSKIDAVVERGKTTSAAIGSGCNEDQRNPINITGSNIFAESIDGAGIGAGYKGDAGEINITGSGVVANSAAGGAAIGGGKYGDGGDITITDSNVTAVSKAYKTSDEFVKEILKMTGSVNVASNTSLQPLPMEYYYGRAFVVVGLGIIAGLAELFGETYSGAGIGGGVDGGYSSITINNSIVTAKSAGYAAAIGSGDEAETNGPIRITDSSIYAEAGQDGAGIGTGNEADNSCDITIVGSDINAHGGNYAAGIGGGDATGGHVDISDSVIKAYGGTDGAGIGSGESGEGNVITITDSDVEAHGGGYAAGIGGGDDSDGGSITITNSAVKAYGGTDAAGIGGGEDGNGGTIKILDSNVYAEGKEYGAGIGGGEDAHGEYCEIRGNSKVEAVAGEDGWGVSIGYGDYASGSSHKTGRVVLSGLLKVKTGNNVYTGDARFKEIFSNKHVVIYECDHSEVQMRPISLTRHADVCRWCGAVTGSTGEHQWTGDHPKTCSVCGVKDNEFDLTFVEKNNSGSVTNTVKVNQAFDYTIPKSTVSPDGYAFACWLDDDGNSYAPGDIYRTGALGQTFTAYYLPLVETEYIDENGAECSVEAMKLSNIDVRDHPKLSLNTGWYVFDSDSSSLLQAKNALLSLRGDVRLILADGFEVDLTSDTQDYVLDGLDDNTIVSLYGQSQQAGRINLTNAKARFRDFRMYGGMLDIGVSLQTSAHYSRIEVANTAVITRGSMVISEGSFDRLDFRGDALFADELSVVKEAKMDWTQIDNYIRAKIIDSENAVFTVADGKGFKDGNNQIYSGTLNSEQISVLRSAATMLTPVSLHDYSEPEWEWAEDLGRAKAVFKCNDCDDVQTVNARVSKSSMLDENYRESYTASCTFLGERYEDDRFVPYKWKVSVNVKGNGIVIPDKPNAAYDETVTLTIAAEDGYSLNHIKAYNKNMPDFTYELDEQNAFEMPPADVVIEAEFVRYRHFDRTEPSITSTGEYVLGNVEYYVDDDGIFYDVNPDGSVNTNKILDSVVLSDFEFGELDDGTLSVVKYLGSLYTTDRIEIPKSYNGKKITTIGSSIIDSGWVSRKTPISLKLNENITTIKASAFYYAYVNKIEGDTSGLTVIADNAFSRYRRLSETHSLEMTLEHEGQVSIGSTAFAAVKGGTTIHLKHATVFDDTSFIDDKITLDFTDAHIPGDPQWTWADDYGSASVTVPCANAACDHSETASAVVSDEFTGDRIVYTATADLYGETLTDTRSISASAAASVAVGDSVTYYRTFDEALTNWTDGSTLRLLADAKPDSPIVVDFSGTLDLNGFAIDRSLQTAAANGNIITNNGVLTITDSSDAQTGMITGAFNSGSGGGIVNTGTLTLNGGAISGNKAAGGGAGIMNRGIVIMNGGAITGNSVSGTGKNGGGIWTNNSLTINGGEIRNNSSATGNGGAISYNNGSLTVSGSPVITDNTASGNPNDVYIWNNDNPYNIITVSGTLDNSAKIGVRLNTMIANPFTSGLSGRGSAENFVSNLSSYAIRLDGNGEAVFNRAYAVTLAPTVNGVVKAPASACEGEAVILTVTPDEGYSVMSVTVNDVEITPEDGVYRFVMPNEDVTVAAAFGFADGLGTRLVGHSISLDGDIAVNFYMELSDSVIAHKDTAYMHFTIPVGGGTTEQKMLVKDALIKEWNGKDYYVFKCRVAAKEMTSEIKAQMIDGDQNGTEYTYSVKEYADYLIEHADEREDLAAAVPLVKKMLNYGAYAQIYFDKNPGTLANEIMDETEKELGDVTITAPETAFDLPTGVTFGGATLSLKSETTLSIYFKSNTTLTFSCGDYTVETAASGGYQIARIRGIKAKHIGDTFNLTVNGGTVTYSPLNYCKNVLPDSTASPDEAQNQQDEKLQNVVKALYLYWQVADAYFPE